MADLPQYPLPNQNVTQIAQTASNVPPNPLGTLSQNIQAGFGMGLQQRQVQALEQERQTQMMQAQQAALKNKVDLLGEFAKMHQEYSDVPSFQHSIMMKGFIPTYNDLAKSMGQPSIDPSQIDFEGDQAPLKDLGKLAVTAVAGKGVQGLPELFQGVSAIESHYGPNSAITKNAKGIYEEATNAMKQQQSVAEFQQQQKVHQDSQLEEGTKTFNEMAKEPITAQNAAKEAIKLLNANNPVGDQIVSVIAPRAEGISQRLNQLEIGKWGGNQAIDQRVAQAIQQSATGKFTQNNRDLFKRVLEILSQSAGDQIDNAVKTTAFNYSQRLGMKPSEVMSQIAGKYGSDYIEKHKQAIQWAQEHPKDPRSENILQKANAELGNQ